MRRDLKQQIKNLDSRELIGRIKTTQVEIQDLVLDKNMNKLADHKAVFKKRKELALLHTILQQKQLINKLEASKVGVKDDVIEQISQRLPAAKLSRVKKDLKDTVITVRKTKKELKNDW